MSSSLNPVEQLKIAYQPKGEDRYANPLDVIGFIEEARFAGSHGERAVMPLFLGSPMFFWEIAHWAMGLDNQLAREAIAATASPGWQFGNGPHSDAVSTVLSEVSRRLLQFDHSIYPFGGNEIAIGRFDFTRELARTYIDELWKPDFDGVSERKRLFDANLNLYHEWLVVNNRLGVSDDDYSVAVELVTSRILKQRFSKNLHGVGRTKIMLERSTSASSTPMGVITANVLRLDGNSGWSTAIIPDLLSIGMLRLTDQFMESIARAWAHHRYKTKSNADHVLVFSVRPTITQMLEQISGRSAEASILAAIESAATGRALRHDVAASAKTEIKEGDYEEDPNLEPLQEFCSSKMNAASGWVKRIVIHEENLDQFNRSRAEEIEPRQDLPRLVGARKHGRDLMQIMEVRSTKGLATLIPIYVGVFFALCGGSWQLVKLSYANVSATLVDPASISPLVLPGLLVTEMLCFLLCVAISLQCIQSCRLNLDSIWYALVTVASCVAIVAAGTMIPIGVRAEGWLDLPFNSVLFGQPQITAKDVIEAGGLGPLVIHSIVQFVSFVTIMLGVVAMTIRLMRSRAASEVILNDRIRLTRLDYFVCMYLIIAFTLINLVFGFLRNGLWHLYLEHLDGVELFERCGALVDVFAPLLAICATLLIFVAALWAIVTGLFLRNVVDSTPEYTDSTTAEGMLKSLPASAKYLIQVGRLVHLALLRQ